jgi:RNA polymerase sigma-70 factor (ECF subfamily)
MSDVNENDTLAATDDTSAKVENNELYKKIEDTIKSLPPKTRQVFEMVRYNKLKYKEVASILDISVKTVEWHMTAAIRTIREAISDYNK